jgi:hypothetical protein
MRRRVGKGGPELRWVHKRPIRRAHAAVPSIRVGTAGRMEYQSTGIAAAFAHPTA